MRPKNFDSLLNRLMSCMFVKHQGNNNVFITLPFDSDTWFIVANAGDQITKDHEKIIVKFDPYCKGRSPNNKNKPFANFITTKIPSVFPLQGYSYDDYILIARRPKELSKDIEIPSITEINRFYDPGDLYCYCYVSGPSGPSVIVSEDEKPINIDYNARAICDRLTYTNRTNTRLILVDNNASLTALVDDLSDMQIFPALMQPKKS